MDFKTAQNIAQEALSKAQILGFDALSISATQKVGFQIRIALGTVCRENIYFDSIDFCMKGVWNTRAFSETISAISVDQIYAALAKARKELELRPENLEWVPENKIKSVAQWDTSSGPFESVFELLKLYLTIEKNVAPLRNKGRRVSGFVSVIENKSQLLSQCGLSKYTCGHAVYGKFTVDNGNGIETGSGQFSVPQPNLELLDLALQNALQEAEWICSLAANPRELSAGDYSIILSSQAAQALAAPLMWYGIFEKRKIDEGRTYLSQNANDIHFPQGLNLFQSHRICNSDIDFADSPFNCDGTVLNDLQLIENQKISGYQYSPYWAQKNSTKETFYPGSADALILQGRQNSELNILNDLNSLIQNTEKGLFVAGMWYIRMVAEMDCLFTGMTRDGVFEIRDGKIVGAVKNMRWHQNILKVFSNTDAITAKAQIFGRSRAAGGGGLHCFPALRTHDFHFSSVTKF